MSAKKKSKRPSPLTVEDYRRRTYRNGRDPFLASDSFTPTIPADSAADTGPGRPPTDTRELVRGFLRDTGLEVLWKPDEKGGGGFFYVYDPELDVPVWRRENFSAVQARVQGWMGRGGVKDKDGKPQIIPSLARKMADTLSATYDPMLPPPPVWRRDAAGIYRPGDGFLVCRNGILDVAAAAKNPRGRKVLLPHTPDFFATGASSHLYLPRDRCPKFDRYLETTFPDEGARALFMQVLGWVVSGERTLPNFLILYGHKGTGKGVAVAVLRALVGEGNHCSIPIHRFADSFVVGALARYRANLVDEAPQGSIICERESERGLVEGTLKQSTGGYDSRISDNTKHVDSKSATSCKVRAANIFAFNPPFPVFKDPALFDRIRALVFEQRFRNTRQEDEHLAEYVVRHEMSGVLNRALEGLKMIGGSRKLPTYALGRAIVRSSRCTTSDDALALWLDERCESKVGAFTPNAELYADFEAWRTALELAQIADNAFTLKLRHAWPDVQPDKSGGVRGLRGIALKSKGN